MSVNSELLQVPFFNISVEALASPDNLIFPQSCAWALQGYKLLMVGGRIEGFHGLTHTGDPFSGRFANDAIRVVDLRNFTYHELPLNINDPNMLLFTASNMEFYQEGDMLYIIGGFGRKTPADKQSNTTYQTLMCINVPAMIQQVENQGNPLSAVNGMVSSPLLQVTGGELFKVGDIFYLVGGQDYQGPYQVSVTGTYTDAIRSFVYSNNQILSPSEYTSPMLHRRDLNLVPIQQSTGKFHAILGGVFTKDNNGFPNPVYIFTAPAFRVEQDTLSQVTSQYHCAKISVYNPSTNAHTTVLLGGIGKYQYHRDTETWEDGDHGAKLPFVNTITQMIYQNGQMTQKIQLPPWNFALPELIGANAIFVPEPNLLYSSDGIIDYSKLPAGKTTIGLMVGGIKSPKPTSSMIYPTSLNRTIYKVNLYIPYPPQEVDLST